jgi:hypothetical protein
MRLLKLIIAEISLLVGGFILLNHLLDRVGFADFVKADQTALNGKNLMNCGIGKHIALQIFDDLMNGDDAAILFVRLEF